MKNFLKSNWIAITICLVWALLVAGGAFVIIKKSAQEFHADSLKAAGELQTVTAALEKANADAAIVKEAWDKEKALNGDLKKMVAETESELDKLRNSLKAMALNTAKPSKPVAVAAKAPPSTATPECRPSDSTFSKNKVRALQKLQADVNRRDRELKEKQKKMDETMDNVAREKRKLILQNTEYRWPHDAVDPGKK